MTKICDFCHPIYDLAKNLIFGDGLFDNYEKVASSKIHTQYFQTRVLKPYPSYDQSG